MSDSIVFTIPGLYNSDSDHWQTQWEKKYGFIRIYQKDWEKPNATDWINTIEDVISSYDLNNIILIGHSLACCTIVQWAEHFGHVIKGALLVGPSDTEAPSYPEGTTGFKPMPLYSLPFPSITVASSNDAYVSLERAKYFADAWGSKLVIAGDLGHINSSSNLGLWPQGYELLIELL